MEHNFSFKEGRLSAEEKLICEGEPTPVKENQLPAPRKQNSQPFITLTNFQYLICNTSGILR